MALHQERIILLLCLFLTINHSLTQALKHCSPDSCDPRCCSISLENTCAKDFYDCSVCQPANCKSGCCSGGVCSPNSSQCQVSNTIFLIICLPFVVIIVLAIIAVTLRLLKKKAAQRRRAQVLDYLGRNQHAISQGQIVNPHEVQAIAALGSIRGRNIRGFKIAPINTVELEATSPVYRGTTPSTMIDGFRGIEIDHKDFTKKMIEDSSSMSPVLMNVSKGSSPTHFDRRRDKDDENLSPFRAH